MIMATEIAITMRAFVTDNEGPVLAWSGIAVGVGVVVV